MEVLFRVPSATFLWLLAVRAVTGFRKPVAALIEHTLACAIVSQLDHFFPTPK
jgi:hypothetical protein